MNKRNYFLGLYLLLFSTLLSAQDNNPRQELMVSVYSTSVAFPTNPINGKMHPGMELGYGYRVNNSASSQFNVGIAIGYFNLKNLMKGFHVKPYIEYKQVIYKDFAMRLSVSPGILFEKNWAKEFTFNNTEGVYTLKNSSRHISFFGIGALQAEYKVLSTTDKNHSTFLRYEFGAQLPYSQSFVPVAPHSRFHGGYILNFK